MHNLRFPWLLMATVLLAGCTATDTPRDITGARLSDVIRSTGRPVDDRAAAGSLARALALALGDDENRALVRNAMRRSPLTEHKLRLREFLATDAGQRLVAAAARASGSTETDVAAWVAALPEMDFYAPFREHRLRWRGTPDLLVGATLDQDAPLLTAYTSDGRAVTLDARHGLPSAALLILHPAERAGVRTDPQPDLPGAVIQEESDGESSGTREWTGADGRTRVAFPRFGGRAWPGGDREAYAPTSGCGTTAVDTCEPAEGSGPLPPDTTFVDYLAITYEDGWGSAEVELRSSYYPSGSATPVERATYRMENVNSFVHYYPHAPLFLREIPPGSGDRITIHVVETDAFDDDDKGTGDWFESNRGLQKAIDAGSWQNGNVIHTTQTIIELDWHL